MSTVVLGYGQLGRALATALRSAPDGVRVWTRREVPGGERLRGVSHHAGADPAAALESARRVFLAVPDGAVAPLVSRLAGLPLDWRGRLALHAAGALGPEVLRPLAERGAHVAACHPLRAFPATHAGAGSPPERPFAGCPFTVEGTSEGEAAARVLVEELGGRVLGSRIRNRVDYHLAATLASNYGLVVRTWAARRFREAGLTTEDAEAASDALARNALANAAAAPGTTSATGAVRRGDASTVEAHLTRLSGAELGAYAALGLLLLQELREDPGAGSPAVRAALEEALDRSPAGAARRTDVPTGVGEDGAA